MNSLVNKLRRPPSRASRRQLAEVVFCLLLAALASPWAVAQPVTPVCGDPFSGVNNYGPYDYRVVESRIRNLVESVHFTPRVQQLIGGASGSLGGDLDYTLRALPNHHPALVSMMTLGTKLKTPQATGAMFSVECYLIRAVLFRPDDAIARMIYAKYLANNGRKPEAVRQLEYTAHHAQDDGFTQYNAGLIYFEFGEFDRARLQAHRALSLGFERPGLKQQLQRAGKWADPQPVGPPGAASSTGSAITSVAPAASSASEPAR